MRSSPCARFALGVLLLSTPAFAQAALDDAQVVVPHNKIFDCFGGDISLSGDRMLVGAFNQGWTLHFPTASGSGAAYVFERQEGGAWVQAAELTASDGAPFDSFGRSVSLSGDRALIGAMWNQHAGPSSGAAYLFERQASGSWLEVAKLTARDAEAGDRFGSSVRLSNDRALCGACLDDSSSGSVYVFERQVDGSWPEVAKLKASDAGAYDLFGWSIGLSGDRALIGANGDGLYEYGGSAYVFERQASGSWREVAKLKASDGTALHFGQAVSLAGDVALVGAWGDYEGGSSSGAAYVFERQAGGSWLEVAKLKAGDAGFGDAFGSSVSLLGGRALVGAEGDDGLTGSAYLFERQADGSWPEVVKLVGQGVIDGSHLGWSVALSEDQAFVGAPLTYAYRPGPSSVRVFDLGTLYHGAPAVSVANGGSQDLLLRAGSEHAGETFVLVGSLSGTTPGLTDPVSGHVLPLNPDAYFLWLLKQGGGGVVSPLLGTLDVEGAAGATFSLPPGSPPSFAGLRLHHAYVALDVPGTGAVALASNAVEVELVP